MSSVIKMTSSQLAAQLRQMQAQLAIVQENERLDAERREQKAAEEHLKREAEERRKQEEKQAEEKKQRAQEAKAAKAAKKKLEASEIQRAQALAEARKGKAREVEPSPKRTRDDWSDPLDPPYSNGEEEESEDDDGHVSGPRAPKKKKRKVGKAQPSASTSSARAPCERCVERGLECRPQAISNSVSCFECRRSKIHCSWNSGLGSKYKSAVKVVDSHASMEPVVAAPIEMFEKIVGAIEGLQKSMDGVASEIRSLCTQVGSWQSELRSNRVQEAEAREQWELEREMEELAEEAEDYEEDLLRQEEEERKEREEEEIEIELVE
ncbi:hypothetical protein DFJ43DRAFT_1162496 [Lentinula guzmanii]|uniref:Zn(2)-C6 fungal-type domain-containing protein n=2 Tax=Lentinula TaxID=5352 RepID=A0AA38J1E4_9AGAR|nr:hypothetical protein DFJ43DRAFT_1162496 [Lentinula guzmanii]KAJ3779783.1 hypothetical protein GGU10DRAFT_381794 [Lentinula aff. detonsa]